ncbi:MAG: transglutaminase-like domain-containing protein, partial [Minisyncoccia bacterium]
SISYAYLKDNFENLWNESQEKKENYKDRIFLEDLANTPELINDIDATDNTNSPLEIGREYLSPKPLFYNGVMIKCDVSEDRFNLDFKGMSYGDSKKNNDILNRLKIDLEVLGFDQYQQINIIEFEKNIDKIAKTITNDLGAPEEEAQNYLNGFLKLDSAKIIIKKYENWEINKDLKFESKLLEKLKEITGKYEKADPEGKDRILEEFNSWGKENGHQNVFNAVEEEQEFSKSSLSEAIPGQIVKSPQEMAETVSEEQLKEENEGFENLFVKKLEEEGYSIDKLKSIAEENPKKIVDILSYAIAKNTEYDYEKYKALNEGTYGKRQTPYHTLLTGKGVCQDYSELLKRAKDYLQKKGVPNMDKFLVFVSQNKAADLDHAWNNLVTVDQDGKLSITSIDLTWAKNVEDGKIEKIGEKIDAIDKKHYYSKTKKKIKKFN